MQRVTDNLQTYLVDHLAGAQFAVSLLGDLRDGCAVEEASHVAAELLKEIEADRAVLQKIVEIIGAEPSVLKEAGAWIAQRLSRTKLRLSESMGTFEAVELLQLGVQGKLSLWNALRTIDYVLPALPGIDLVELAARAEQQAAVLETLRLKLAAAAFTSADPEVASKR